MDIKNSIIKQKNILFLIIIAVIFVSFILCKKSNNTLYSKISFLNYEIKNWEERYLNFANSYTLEVNLKLEVMDIEGNLLNLEDLLQKEKHTIIFRYNERSCRPCLFEEIVTIKNGIKHGFNLVILCNFYDYSEFINFCRVNQFSGKAYLIKEGSFSSNANEFKHIPYYAKFEFDKYKGILVPITDYPDLTMKWFDFD